jgi:hypothetical protein
LFVSIIINFSIFITDAKDSTIIHSFISKSQGG